MQITHEIAEKACEMVLPAIIGMMDAGQAKRKQLVISVRGEDGSTIFTKYIGNFDEFEGPYYDIAISKSRVAFDTKMDTMALQQFPHLMIFGHTHWTGGVYRPNFSVGVSGVQSHYDHLFGCWVAEAILGLFRDSFARFRHEQPTENFLPN